MNIIVMRMIIVEWNKNDDDHSDPECTRVVVVAFSASTVRATTRRRSREQQKVELGIDDYAVTERMQTQYKKNAKQKTTGTTTPPSRLLHIIIMTLSFSSLFVLFHIQNNQQPFQPAAGAAAARRMQVRATMRTKTNDGPPLPSSSSSQLT